MYGHRRRQRESRDGTESQEKVVTPKESDSDVASAASAQPKPISFRRHCFKRRSDAERHPQSGFLELAIRRGYAKSRLGAVKR
jgi:hypothetical protein